MSELNYKYVNNGSKKTIVFLHGWGMDSRAFDKCVSTVSSVSTIVIDLYGFGESVEPKDYFDTYEYSYQIFLLLKKLSIDNIVLVGHSFGGRLAIILSSCFKLNVKALVLTSSAGLNRFELKKWIKIKFYKILKSLVKFKILSGQNLLKYGSNDYLKSSKIMKKILIKVVNQDLSFCAKKIKTKTLLVWDKKDKDTGYWICKKLHKIINSSTIVLYKTGGHFTAFKNINKFTNLLKSLT